MKIWNYYYDVSSIHQWKKCQSKNDLYFLEKDWGGSWRRHMTTFNVDFLVGKLFLKHNPISTLFPSTYYICIDILNIWCNSVYADHEWNYFNYIFSVQQCKEYLIVGIISWIDCKHWSNLLKPRKNWWILRDKLYSWTSRKCHARELNLVYS